MKTIRLKIREDARRHQGIAIARHWPNCTPARELLGEYIEVIAKPELRADGSDCNSLYVWRATREWSDRHGYIDQPVICEHQAWID
jgi:hypothetical protein